MSQNILSRLGLDPRRFDNLIPPGALGRYILTVGIVGTGIIIYALIRAPLGHPELLVVLFLMSLITEWAPIQLKGTPLQGSSLSVSASAAFAALLLLGPAGSVLVNLGSATAYILRQKRPFFKRFLTTSALAMSSAAAALPYWLFGGESPIDFDTSSIIAAGLAALTYFIVNAVLISGAISLATGRPFRSVLSNWQWLFLQMLSSLAIGLFMALAVSMGGSPLVLILTASLLILPWYSTRVYVQKSRQVAEQNEQLVKTNAELAEANRSLDRQIQGLQALHSIGLSLNSAQRVEVIFNEILNSVRELIHADTCAIFMYEPDKSGLVIAGHIGLSELYLNKPELALNGSAARALRENRVLVMDLASFNPHMLSAAADREGIKSVACLPLTIADETVGGLDVCTKTRHAFTAEELDLLRTLAQQAAVAIYNARLTEQIHESYLSTIHALTAAVEAKDLYTRGHSEVVRQLAVATGRQLGLSGREMELLNISALFHDIGKIGIPESILNKNEPLDEAEWMVMREHPVIGERILSKIPALAEVPRIVRHHHERYDGTGYPDGISGEGNLLAAIIGVCDSYQAMTSDRPYRKGMSQHQALEEIRRGAGTQFAPRVVEAFCTVSNYQDAQDSKIVRLDQALVLQRHMRTQAGGALRERGALTGNRS